LARRRRQAGLAKARRPSSTARVDFGLSTPRPTGWDLEIFLRATPRNRIGIDAQEIRF
jgi:hypothetical protein